MRKETVTLLRAVRQRAEKIRAGSGSPKADAQRALGDEKRSRLNLPADRQLLLGDISRLLPKKPRKLIPYAGKEHGAREDLMGNNGSIPKRKAKT